jgi:hypothetical protein
MVTSSHIVRVVLGLTRHEDVPSYHKPYLGLVKTCPATPARHDVPCVPRSLNTMRHKAREGRAGPTRHDPKSWLYVTPRVFAQG